MNQGKTEETMNILLINGSPKGKNSNTYKLATAFIEGLKSKNSDTVSVEELPVYQLEIKPCLGCFSCWKNTPGTCVIQDDMKTVLEKLLWADITVWSFPLFYFNVPGKLKMLIDRQLPMALPFMETEAESGGHPTRFDMSKKRHVLISTCGFYTAKGNYDSVIPMFQHLLGKGNFETIFCGQGELFRVPELMDRTNEYLGYVKDAGTQYLEGKISDSTREQLETLLFPREMFESMADASWGIDERTGKKMDETLIFVKQMAALYNTKSYQGQEKVLEMDFTDVDKKYQILLKEDGSEVLTENFKEATIKIITPFTVWADIASGKLNGGEALMKQMYRVEGDYDIIMRWNDYFGGN